MPRGAVLIGQTVSHYKILEKIGQGGMGVVYKAEDTRLRRPVALKFLSPTHTENPQSKKRFINEAQAVSRLQHAGICTIHEINETADGQLFICMDYYDGETLKDVIARGGVPVAMACDVGIRAADALARAHDGGIIHRDVKPANLIVLADGQVILMDFGIAKLAGQTRLTKTDSTVGTAAYMSPEQARGEDLDGRSDVFSLALVLYEMVSGANPFSADNDLAVMYRIMNVDPPSLSAIRDDCPEAVAAVVAKALAKNARDRHSGAREFAAALAATRATLPDAGPATFTGAGLPTGAASAHATDTPTFVPNATALPGSGGGRATGTGEREIDSLAVLPFVNDSGDADVDYLSDGLTDTLIDNLSQLPRLRVMARSSVFTYAADATANPRRVGTELGVRAVLTGRLTHRGDNLMIRAELVDARDGTLLWGDRFRRPFADLLDVEDEISREILRNLRLKLNPEEKEMLAKRHTENPEAHRAYLKGRHVWNRWKTPEGMRTAIGFFERALELDPLYALAFAGLADSHSMLGNVKAVPPGEAYPKAKTAALQGLAIDESLAELHASLGFVQRFWEWDWAAAESSFKRAIELNPGYPVAYRFYGQLLGGLGRFDEAIPTSTRAVDLDPLSPLIIGALGDMYFYARRYEEAIALYKKTLELDPEFLAGHTDLARAYELAGRYDDAIAEFETAAALAPKGPPEPSSGMAHVYAQMGEREKALAILDQLIDMRKRRYVSPYGIASIYSCLREIESAFEWLETAYKEHDQTLVWVKVHPRLDPLRDNPRYQDLLRRMNL